MNEEPKYQTQNNHPEPRYGRPDKPWTPPKRPKDVEAASEYTGEKLRTSPREKDQA